MDPRLAAAVIAGKTTAAVSRALRRGGGTALPGLVAGRVDPATVAKLGRQLNGDAGLGVVLITGTNGKTTASRLLAAIAREAGLAVLANREGSNMMRGFASTLVGAARADGRLGAATGARLGIFETDEASLPAAVAALGPRAIAFTNLFRDQLDRYGEVDNVAALWREALAVANPATTTLVLNADDPSVAELSVGWEGAVHWFGIDIDSEDAGSEASAAGAVDARWCRSCGGSFRYDRRLFAHVGHWRCGGCDWRRPAPDTAATEIQLELDHAAFTVPGLGRAELQLTGLYNVANALAAVGLARVLGLEDEAIRAGLARARPAFGRQEVVEFEGRRLRLFLAKNPAGANEVLRLLDGLSRREGAPPLRLAFLLNDRFADGQDVSWTWDVDFELLAGRVAAAWAGGTRAEDAALRLDYAGCPPPQAVESAPSALLDAIVASTGPGDEVFVVHTYTAMLDLRAELGRRGAVRAFWR